MDLNNTLTFGGINSATYGIYIDGSGVFNSPERDVTMVTIPSRNGQLSLDNGRFENIEVTYNAFVTENNGKTMAENIRDFRNAIGSLKGYQRLEDTYHTDEFRMGVFRNGIEVEPVIYQTGGAFEVTFDCKPQRFICDAPTGWLESGGVVYYEQVQGNNTDVSATKANPFLFEASPNIVLTPNQASTAVWIYEFTINGKTVTWTVQTGNTKTLYINGDTWDAYSIVGGAYVSENANVTFTNGFPTLPANSSFTINTTATNASGYTLRIEPNFWRI